MPERPKIPFVPITLLMAFLAFSLSAFGQIHVERDENGRIVITDQYREKKKPTVQWDRKGGLLRVFDAKRDVWNPAPKDYPGVAGGRRLFLAYGPGQCGCAVYDFRRHRWYSLKSGHSQGRVSGSIAVAFDADGYLHLYDGRRGVWVREKIPCGQVVLSDEFCSVYGRGYQTSVYDVSSGKWYSSTNSYDRCLMSQILAVFFRTGVPGLTAFDRESRQWNDSRAGTTEVKVVGDIVAAYDSARGIAAYSSRGRKWISFRRKVQTFAIQNGEVLVTAANGERWTYYPGQSGGFTRRYERN